MEFAERQRKGEDFSLNKLANVVQVEVFDILEVATRKFASSQIDRQLRVPF